MVDAVARAYKKSMLLYKRERRGRERRKRERREEGMEGGREREHTSDINSKPNRPGARSYDKVSFDIAEHYSPVSNETE